METSAIVDLVKLDLTMSTTAYDGYLTNLVERAKAAIKQEGITLDMNETADVMVVVQFTAYLWRKRKGEDLAMPRSLRYALNNYHVSQHGGDSSGS